MTIQNKNIHGLTTQTPSLKPNCLFSNYTLITEHSKKKSNWNTTTQGQPSTLIQTAQKYYSFTFCNLEWYKNWSHKNDNKWTDGMWSTDILKVCVKLGVRQPIWETKLLSIYLPYCVIVSCILVRPRNFLSHPRNSTWLFLTHYRNCRFWKLAIEHFQIH